MYNEPFIEVGRAPEHETIEAACLEPTFAFKQNAPRFALIERLPKSGSIFSIPSTSPLLSATAETAYQFNRLHLHLNDQVSYQFGPGVTASAATNGHRSLTCPSVDYKTVISQQLPQWLNCVYVHPRYRNPPLPTDLLVSALACVPSLDPSYSTPLH